MIEIETRDPDVALKLRTLAAADPEQIQDITASEMTGAELATIVIVNIGAISTAAAAILATLRFDVLRLRMSKDGIELHGKTKEAILAQAGDA